MRDLNTFDPGLCMGITMWCYAQWATNDIQGFKLLKRTMLRHNTCRVRKVFEKRVRQDPKSQHPENAQEYKSVRMRKTVQQKSALCPHPSSRIEMPDAEEMCTHQTVQKYGRVRQTGETRFVAVVCRYSTMPMGGELFAVKPRYSASGFFYVIRWNRGFVDSRFVGKKFYCVGLPQPFQEEIRTAKLIRIIWDSLQSDLF